MKTCMAVTIERRLFNTIEQMRGREKRSTFVEHLLQLGIREYQRLKKKEDSRET